MFMYVWLRVCKCVLKNCNLEMLKYTHFLQNHSDHFDVSKLTR